MKQVLSLLFVALMALSARADFTVTFIPGTTVGNNMAANAYDEMSLNGVTISCTAGAFAQNPYRFGGGGSTTTVSSTVGNIKKVEFTCVGSFSQAYGPDFYGDGYTAHSGSNIGIWQGDAASFTLNAASQVRCTKIEVTIAEAVVTELVAPVFTPNGGEFTGSVMVSLSCATENAEIYYFEGDPDGDWAGFSYYNGPFPVTETKTLTAYSSKGGDISDYVTVTFTKVEPTVEAPVFTPASCSFDERLDVTLTCATAGAKIYYSLDEELWSEYVDPIPVTDDITIWAKAVVGDLESEVVSATYTKNPDTAVKVTFDATVDTGDGSTTRNPYTIVKDPVTMYVSDGTVYSTHYRAYSGAEITFTSTGAPIIKIEFDGISGYTASNISKAEGNEGTYTTGGTDGVWEGNAYTVPFKVNSQARFTTITVTLGAQAELLLGDVDHDGKVDINDVTAMIDYLLADADAMPAEGDFNQDGKKNIDDVTEIIDFLLGK